MYQNLCRIKIGEEMQLARRCGYCLSFEKMNGKLLPGLKDIFSGSSTKSTINSLLPSAVVAEANVAGMVTGSSKRSRLEARKAVQMERSGRNHVL